MSIVRHGWASCRGLLARSSQTANTTTMCTDSLALGVVDSHTPLLCPRFARSGKEKPLQVPRNVVTVRIFPNPFIPPQLRPLRTLLCCTGHARHKTAREAKSKDNMLQNRLVGGGRGSLQAALSASNLRSLRVSVSASARFLRPPPPPLPRHRCFSGLREKGPVGFIGLGNMGERTLE